MQDVKISHTKQLVLIIAGNAMISTMGMICDISEPSFYWNLNGKVRSQLLKYDTLMMV